MFQEAKLVNILFRPKLNNFNCIIFCVNEILPKLNYKNVNLPK